MSNKSTGQKTIAYELGLSINTVSRALRDCDDISASTKEAVRKKAYEIGYMDNALVDFDATLADKKLSCKIQDSKLTIDSAAWKAAFPETTALGQKNPSNAYVHEFKVNTTVYPGASSSSASDSASLSSVPTDPYVTTETVTDFVVYWAGSTGFDEYYTNSVWGVASDFPKKDKNTTIFILGESGFKAYKLATSATTSALSSGSRIECQWNAPAIQGFDLATLSTTSSHGAIKIENALIFIDAGSPIIAIAKPAEGIGLPLPIQFIAAAKNQNAFGIRAIEEIGFLIFEDVRIRLREGQIIEMEFHTLIFL